MLDKAGTIFTRIWCCYEAHVSLVTSKPVSGAGSEPPCAACLAPPALRLPCAFQASGCGLAKHARASEPRLCQGYLFDVYTSLGSGRGVGLTDGMAVCDILNATPGQTKKTREDKFPLELAHRSLSTTLEVAKASVESDRIHILNKMAGMENLNAAPPETHIRYDDLNGTLRSRFAAGSIVRAFSAGDKPENMAMQQQMIKCLGDGTLRHLDLNFDSCWNFTEESARQLAQHMPRGLGQMTLRLNGHGDAFMHQLCMQYRLYGGMEKLSSLDFEGNGLSARGVLEISKTMKSKFLMNMANLKLDKNHIDDMDMVTLCRAFATGALPYLAFLSLEENKIGDKGMQALAKLIKDKDMLPNLDRLMLRGNPAFKLYTDQVFRELKARGRGLKQSSAVEEAGSSEKADQRKAARVWEPAAS